MMCGYVTGDAMEKVQMAMSRPESGEWLGNADIMTYAGDAKGEGAGNRHTAVSRPGVRG